MVRKKNLQEEQPFSLRVEMDKIEQQLKINKESGISEELFLKTLELYYAHNGLPYIPELLAPIQIQLTTILKIAKKILENSPKTETLFLAHISQETKKYSIKRIVKGTKDNVDLDLTKVSDDVAFTIHNHPHTYFKDGRFDTDFSPKDLRTFLKVPTMGFIVVISRNQFHLLQKTRATTKKIADIGIQNIDTDIINNKQDKLLKRITTKVSRVFSFKEEYKSQHESIFERYGLIHYTNIENDLPTNVDFKGMNSITLTRIN